MTTPMQIVKELRKKYPDKHITVNVEHNIFSDGAFELRYYLYIADVVDTIATKGEKEDFINIVKDYLK